jgi:signal transduction histidine kinase
MRLNELLCQQQISRRENNRFQESGEDMINAIENSSNDLESILSVVHKINSSLVLSEVLGEVIDHTIRSTRADRGFLMLADDNGKLQYTIGRDKEKNVISSETFQVSQSVVEDVYSTGESICIEDALSDERFEQRQSIVKLELRTIMCTPLKTHDKTIGVVYVDSQHIQPVNQDKVLRLFEILAGQAALAIQNARLYEDLKKTYDELQDANEHLIKSEKLALRGELVAEVSHELKNLLGVVLLQAHSIKLALERDNVSKGKAMSSDIIDSILKIDSFAESLLVRSGSGFELVPTHLNSIVSKFASFIKFLPRFRKSKIVASLDETTPIIEANADQLQHVLLNLVNNAVDAYPEATITLATEYDPLDNQVILSVSDNGPGIDAVVRRKLFVEKITTKPDGHGFGLPICKKIIDSHKSKIEVDSQFNQGAKFNIFFPPLSQT